MKKLVALILMLAVVLALCGCGKSDAVIEVEKAINDIGEVSLDSKLAIEKAEKMYGLLTDKEKESVENRLALSSARGTYDQLVEEENARIAEEEARLAAEEAERRAEEERLAAEEAERQALILAAAMEQLPAVRAALSTAESDLSFVQKYAGNVNNAGSRKFADSFVTELRTCFDGIDMEALAAGLPDVAEKVAEIKANCDIVCDLLVDMGKTNLPTNVDRIKSTASSTLTLIGTLRDGVLSQYK